MASPAPLNPDTDPGRDIPLREVPATTRELREAWAREYTRANTLDAALGRSQQATDDWRYIALLNGEELAKARVQIARMEIDAADARRRAEMNEAALADDAAEWRRRAQANFARADKLAEYVAADFEHRGEDASWEHVRELIEAAGVECLDCEGKGLIDDEVMLGDPGDKYGYTTRDVRDECGACSGIGKVLR